MHNMHTLLEYSLVVFIHDVHVYAYYAYELVHVYELVVCIHGVQCSNAHTSYIHMMYTCLYECIQARCTLEYQYVCRSTTIIL